MSFWVYYQVSDRHEARTAEYDDEFVRKFPDESAARAAINQHNVELFNSLMRSGLLPIGLTLLDDDA